MGQPPQIQNLKGNLTLLYFNSGTKIGKDPNNYKARMNFISKSVYDINQVVIRYRMLPIFIMFNIRLMAKTIGNKSYHKVTTIREVGEEAWCGQRPQLHFFGLFHLVIRGYLYSSMIG